MGMKPRKKLAPNQAMAWIWEYKNEPGIYYSWRRVDYRTKKIAEAELFKNRLTPPIEGKAVHVLVTVQALGPIP